MVGPNYYPPAISVESAWSEAPRQIRRAAAEPRAGAWWKAFKDPELDLLIGRAVEANLDLEAAQARIREARATVKIQAAPLWPELDATESYTRSWQSQNAIQNPGGSTVENLAIGGQPGNLYEPGFDANWEIDVFGGTRRSVEAAQASLEASVYDRDDVLLTLLGDVASYYIDVRNYQIQMEVTRKNLAARISTLNLTRARFEAGMATDLDVAQQETQVWSTASQIPSLDTSYRQSIHRLGVLLGDEPSALSSELAAATPIPLAPPQLPAGLPSDLLRRRPDIRRDERKLAAAVANIGVATADLFPKFSLTSAVGLQSVSASDLFTASSFAWSLGPTVTWPIFEGGKITANITKTRAQSDEALATYEQTVLTALEEVENQIVAYTRERECRQLLADAVGSSQRAVDLSTELYLSGLKSFLDVLEAQGTLLTSETDLAASDAAVAKDLVALNKALGGGWQDVAMPDIKTPSSTFSAGPCLNQQEITRFTVLAAPVPRAGSGRGPQPSRWSPRTGSCRNRG